VKVWTPLVKEWNDKHRQIIHEDYPTLSEGRRYSGGIFFNPLWWLVDSSNPKTAHVTFSALRLASMIQFALELDEINLVRTYIGEDLLTAEPENLMLGTRKG